MKKEIIVCDKCKKEFEEKTSIYATIYINTNGMPTERCDVCGDCWQEIFNYPTEKGGAE